MGLGHEAPPDPSSAAGPAPDDGATSIEVRGVYKDFGGQRALGGVSLRLVGGQLTALLGENGAGKSTLLGVLSTLVRPSRGEVLIDGIPLAEVDPRELRAALAVLSHEPRCYADLTGRENLRFFGGLYGLSGEPAALERSIDEMLERVGLIKAADRPARTLSRGMLQRLALARVLLPRPRLLLLDEPYTGLDRDGVALLTRLLAEERGRGALLAVITHDLDALAPICDHAAVLHRGRIAAEARYAPGTCDGAALLRLYHEAAKSSAERAAERRSRHPNAAPEQRP